MDTKKVMDKWQDFLCVNTLEFTLKLIDKDKFGFIQFSSTSMKKEVAEKLFKKLEEKFIPIIEETKKELLAEFKEEVNKP